MAKTRARAGIGTIITAAGTAIAEVMQIKGPSSTLKMLDATNNDSPGYTDEMIPANIHPDEVTLDCNFLSEVGQNAMVTAHQARSLIDFTILYPIQGISPHRFSAYVTKINCDEGFDKKITRSMGLQITGQITYAS